MKRVITFFVLMFAISPLLLAQTPQFFNYSTGANANSFPFGIAGGKMVQHLVLPGELTGATAGNITKFYVRIATGYPLNSTTYTSFYIRMGQSTITTLTSGAFYSGAMDTVYRRASVTLAAAADTWLMFTLDQPFVYNPAQSLIIEIGQCAGAGATGFPLAHTILTDIRRVWSVGGCPFVAYAGGNANVMNCGIDVTSGPAITLPDLIYYKFKNNPSPTSTPNFAIPGVGTNPAPLTTLTLTSGGQFDSCLSGTATASAKIVTGYSLSTGTSSFTISMWLSELVTPATTRYLFGDVGLSFRCFVGGVAPSSGAVLRGTGVTDVPINGIFPGPNVIHIVYDSASSSVKVYKNGVFQNAVSQTPFNFTAGTGFSVGGYSSSAGLEGKMDEFRFYKRALDSAEIASTWNVDLGTIVTGVTPISSSMPTSYSLSQNYPNPFNPVTKISFDLPKSGLVTLKIYDVIGKEIKTLVNDVKSAGKYIVDFDGSSFASGTYFYRLESNGFVSTKKMMLIK